MKITFTTQEPSLIAADALVVGLLEGSPLEGSAAEIDAALGGVLSKLIDREEAMGGEGELTVLLGHQGAATPVVVAAGLGDRVSLDARVAYRAASAAALKLAGKARQRVAFCLDLEDPLREAAVCGAMTGSHGCDLYRAEKKTHPFAEVIWSGGDRESVERAGRLGDSVNLARDLVNQPAGHLYPETFAEAAGEVAAQTGLELEVWDGQKLQAERCGALLAVAQGSTRPPRLVMLRHRGGGDGPWLALVGKGVTFDSGGLSIKPSDGMKTMKGDMAGAAAVLGAMRAVALLSLPANVIGLCGLAENMVSGDSYKLGDVLTARNGRTIEVLNTDAEGRLVLADVLDVAVESGASKIIDLATLTGACVVALGNETAGLMTNDQAWCDVVADAARHCGERAWQLPMFAEYGEQISSPVADIKNVGEGRWGGAITAAKFLEEFVGDTPWTHIDIAGPAFLDTAKPWLSAGGTGAFVRTVVEVARRWGAAGA